MPVKHFKVDHVDNVVVVTLNRPEAKNALNIAMLEEFTVLLGRLKGDSRVHGILITGSGNSFCAGADIAEMAAMTPQEAARYSECGQQVMFAVETAGKPVLAAVNGYALGGGLELALACDFILASRSAVFAAPEIQLGIIPGFGGTQRLSRLVGKSRAKEMIFTGARIDAAKALAIGLVNSLHDDTSLLPEALQLLKSICTRGLLSLRMAKEAIDAGNDIDLRNACMMERDAFALCFSTGDQKEGMAAFLEKRQPKFTGSQQE